MNSSTARQLVIISMLGTGGVVAYDIITHNQLSTDQTFKAVWSLALLFLLLAMLADVAPELAGPLAGLVLLAVLVGRGAALNKIVEFGTPHQ